MYQKFPTKEKKKKICLSYRIPKLGRQTQEKNSNGNGNRKEKL